MRIINIIDEGSRRALWTEAHKSISGKKLTEILDHVVEYRVKPAYIRCDNGPEFISQKLELWAQEHQIELRFIQPGKPSQNGLIERLNKTLRTECLNLCWFTSKRYKGNGGIKECRTCFPSFPYTLHTLFLLSRCLWKNLTKKYRVGPKSTTN